MSIWFAALQGLVQGLTEFLPVSSSGHLVLVQALFGSGVETNYMLFNVLLHLARCSASSSHSGKISRNCLSSSSAGSGTGFGSTAIRTAVLS